MACIVSGCKEETHKKFLMCNKHWKCLPETLREDVRKDTEKGMHTLSVRPSRDWLAAASKHVGNIRNLDIRVDAGEKISRKFEKEPIRGRLVPDSSSL
jgi:uncharacterized protein with PhoU and TrkA domain